MDDNKLTTVEQTIPQVSIDNQMVKQYTDQMESIMMVKTTILKQGTHYGVMPGVNKPFLWQTGADAYCKFFNLMVGEPIVQTISEPNGNKTFIVKVTIITMKGQHVVGYGLGLSTTMESKFNAGKNAAKSRADFYNTCVKMAYKRAYVSALIKVCNLAILFSQDQDAVTPPNSNVPNLDPQSRQQFTNGNKSDGGKPISDAQAKRFYAKAKENGFDTDAKRKTYLKSFGYESSKDIQRPDYEKIIDGLTNEPSVSMQPMQAEIEMPEPDWADDSKVPF